MNESTDAQNGIEQTEAHKDIEQTDAMNDIEQTDAQHGIDERDEAAPDDSVQMRPIWYFVGVILAVIGGLVVISGVVNLMSPPAEPTVLARLHVNLWWGLIITIAGVAMWLTNRRGE
jgi:hypothetical protein